MSTPVRQPLRSFAQMGTAQTSVQRTNAGKRAFRVIRDLLCSFIRAKGTPRSVGRRSAGNLLSPIARNPPLRRPPTAAAGYEARRTDEGHLYRGFLSLGNEPP